MPLLPSTVRVGLGCPICRTALLDRGSEMTCLACGHRYGVEDGILRLVPGSSGQSGRQIQYFDQIVDTEFEIDRPHGLPALYGWLLGEKYRRAVAGLDLREASALVVCGGSGLDAEFLANSGARVITSDLSLGAARRARERARRRALHFESIVADVEHLPFPDRSVDIVYVHDGLHHLEDPYVGLREMARVTRRVICVTEPAQALATSLAVKVGLALEREEAGNRVARLRVNEVCRRLEDEGLRIVRVGRYAMLYRHEPGLPMRVLSRKAFLPAARAGLRLANTLVGPHGNKLVVTAVRL
jgi:SAM-dependent methyltransferase